MEFTERVYRTLIVSSNASFAASMAKMLPPSRFSPVRTAQTAACARLMLLDTEFDIIIINAPLSDEYGIEFAQDISDTGHKSVLVIIPADDYPELNSLLAPQGILAVSKPTPPSTVLQAIDLMCATSERLKRLEARPDTFEEKMREIRIINRAKMLLISRRKMSEKEAHRFIEKQAMDNCVKKQKIAEDIIRHYESREGSELV